MAEQSHTAHYGDPCLYCGTKHDDVAPGPCPARANNKVGDRVRFCMSQADYDGLVGAVQAAINSPLIALNAGMSASPQEAANKAWRDLGKRLGFDGMSARPGDGPLDFTAICTGAGQ